MHETGEAIDFRVASGRAIKATDPEYRWLKAHAATYGFFNLPSETWHWSINGK
jgi:D-alanyl-D-alanine carboxypeptidase